MGVGDSNFLNPLACFVTELLQYKLNKSCQKVTGIMFVFYIHATVTYIVCTSKVLSKLRGGCSVLPRPFQHSGPICLKFG